jgi:hypothetical protein
MVTKEFLISRIAAEAEREGVPFSEVERQMLYFSETAWTLPNMMAINDQFERRYDPDEYEDKVARLIRTARRRARREDRPDFEDWSAAIRTLSKEDHYILVMVKQAGGSVRPPGDLLKLWGTALTIIFIFVLLMPFLPAHAGPRLFLVVWLIAVGIAVLYAASWIFLGRQRTDELADKLTAKLLGPFRPSK